MPNPDQLNAFIAAAETGSFSAAARRLKKAQSAVSNAVINLEIESGVELFDRSKRSPVLTKEGETLLKSAYAIMESHHDFIAHTMTLNAGQESHLCIAIEQNISTPPIVELLVMFEQKFPYIELELLDPGTSDVAALLRSGRAHLGLMMEQEHYPKGFMFRGIGHSRKIPVCSKNHPLAQLDQVSHGDLRRYRQLVPRSLDPDDRSHEPQILSPKVWYAESPFVIAELLTAGLGWASMHEAVVQDRLDHGVLVALKRTYQQDASLQGIDVVWSKHKPLGIGGQWLLNECFKLRLR